MKEIGSQLSFTIPQPKEIVANAMRYTNKQFIEEDMKAAGFIDGE